MKKFIQINENEFKLEDVSTDLSPSSHDISPHGKSPVSAPSGGAHRGITYEDEFKIKRLKDELEIKREELVFRTKEIHNLHTEISGLQDELNFLTHKK